ncbi:MAG TPA: hypothetical protein VKA08_14530 [Balneolales bacterium]|nr:hypothetical protein [Balneolales bacterium]
MGEISPGTQPSDRTSAGINKQRLLVPRTNKIRELQRETIAFTCFQQELSHVTIGSFDDRSCNSSYLMIPPDLFLYMGKTHRNCETGNVVGESSPTYN